MGEYNEKDRRFYQACKEYFGSRLDRQGMEILKDFSHVVTVRCYRKEVDHWPGTKELENALDSF